MTLINSTNSSNKSISGCGHCSAYVIIDSTIKDQNGDCITLDLNQKRHFCSDSDKILHEGNTVEHVKKLIEAINKTELSSFELELRIVDGVNK
jgi:hypothetical protein